ncbi:NYN domain-containing protein [Nocardioidaceae bacterium]|nr:NYN domain-containing protein [Nocardioidaceae bacterium]
MSSSDNMRLAVLIDADNAQASLTSAMLAELAKYGTLTVKRAYGDWTTTRLGGWKKQLNENAITPMQQFAYTTGKNATDSAMIIDAMDLLYAADLDGFCIVSSDSDFTRLATRLRESGKTVYGLGQRKTPGPFIAACDKFIFAEVLGGGSAKPTGGGGGGSRRGKGGAKKKADTEPTVEVQETEPQDTSGDESGDESRATTTVSRRTRGKTKQAPEPDPVEDVDDDVDELEDSSEDEEFPAIEELLQPAIEGTAKESGWASLGQVGSYVNKRHSSFDPRNYGYPRLSVLVGDLDWVEVKEVPDANDFPQLWVRVAGKP